MVTQLLFTFAVAVLALQRLAELRHSRRNVVALRREGAIEAGAGQMPWMRLMHAAWLVAMPLEVFLLDRPFAWAVFAVALVGVVAGQTLRHAAIRTLGERWTVRVMVLPGAEPVTHGIFRRLRHPNYLGVILEIACVPLLHGAWLTAVVFSILNGLMLRARIRTEEAALQKANDYESAFADRPRFVPR